MRARTPRIYALVALALFAVSPPDLTASQEALTVADLDAVALDGGRLSGEKLRGRLVLVDFWAVWCLPCIQAFPTLSRLQDEHGERGLRVLGVAVYSGSRQDVADFLKEHDLSYPVVVGDEELVARFDVIGYPTYFLFAPDGSLVETYVGEMESLAEEVAAAVERYLPQDPSRTN